MSAQNIFIAHPETEEQINALKVIAEALKVEYELSTGENGEESPYDPEFVAKIQESRQQVREGKVTRVEKDGLKKFLGL